MACWELVVLYIHRYPFPEGHELVVKKLVQNSDMFFPFSQEVGGLGSFPQSPSACALFSATAPETTDPASQPHRAYSWLCFRPHEARPGIPSSVSQCTAGRWHRCGLLLGTPPFTRWATPGQQPASGHSPWHLEFKRAAGPAAELQPHQVKIAHHAPCLLWVRDCLLCSTS